MNTKILYIVLASGTKYEVGQPLDNGETIEEIRYNYDRSQYEVVGRSQMAWHHVNAKWVADVYQESTFD